MNIGSVKLGNVIDPRQAYGPATGGQSGASSFVNHLRSAVDKVDAAQGKRDSIIEAMVTGEVGEVHDVMIAAEEAQLSFELMLEVRNKLIDSYQQIMQMQI